METKNVMSQKLLTLFDLYKTRRFVFVEPGGNFGDLIIYQGANKLAKAASVFHKTVSFAEFMGTCFPREVVVYIHGGGGINQIWSGKPIKALKKALASHRGPVILGPSTFQADEAFLGQFVEDVFSKVVSEDVFLFFRERHSYEAFRAKSPTEVNMFVDHDTALNLDKSDMPVVCSQHTDVLYCIRSDKEMNSAQGYSFWSKWVDPVKCSRNFEEWLALHEGAWEIITNRLHSAIMGVILGVPVTLLPNSYHKNRATWEYSLRQKGVQWADRICLDQFNGQLNRIKTLRKIRNSRLYQRLIRRVLI